MNRFLFVKNQRYHFVDQILHFLFFLLKTLFFTPDYVAGTEINYKYVKERD